MSNMDVNERISLESLLTEYARQAERLGEQICEIRRQHIERTLKLFEECRRVDRTLTMQTTELKAHIDRLQKHINQLQPSRQDRGDIHAEESKSVAVNLQERHERERPLTAIMEKLLACPEKQKGENPDTVGSTCPSGQKSPQKPRSGPLDSEEVKKVAEMARRLASYQNLPIHYPCLHQHEQTS